MFDSIDHVHFDHGVPIRFSCTLAHVLEGAIGVDVVQLLLLSVSPLGVPILGVQIHGVCVIAWNFDAILIHCASTKRLELGLVDHADESLLLAGCFLVS